MRVIGITGGVGAGKSRVLEILEKEFHAHVILTDEVAHSLMEPGKTGYEQVLAAFGKRVAGEGGSLDRKRLSDLIFQDGAARRTMDRIIHPMAWAQVESMIRESRAELVVVETALPGKKLGDICDELWYVYTSRENRVKRLSESRGYTTERSEAIMASQASEEEFSSMCSQVIDNNGSFEDTAGQIRKLLENKGR